LSGEVLDMRLTPGTEMVVIDGLQRVVAYPQLERIIVGAPDQVRLAHLDELGIEALDTLVKADLPGGGVQPFDVAAQTWYGLSLPLSRLSASDARILLAIPAQELLAGARQAVLERSLWVLFLAAVVVLAGWALGARIGAPLKALTDQLQALSDFDFSRPPGVRSKISEVNRLAAVMVDMARTIDNFQAITLSLSREPRLEHMLEVVLVHLVRIAAGCRAVVYLCSDDVKQLQRAAEVNGGHYPQLLPVDEAILQQQPQRALESLLEADRQALSLVLHDRRGVLLGVVMIELQDDLHAKEVASLRRFLQGLAGSLAVAIETRQLFEGQQRLLEAVIKLLADAIDAKSPYTAGHCERVPQLAEMLLDKAVAQSQGPFADFRMDEDERYAFHIAAWMHDCGKITSPEYVVDKATKLETLYNRLHEVRMRFEVLWRDARIVYLQALAAGDEADQAEARLQQRQQQLQTDFALVARVNLGSESVSDADLQALQRIAEETWLRHFDDRIGLSVEEQMRLADEPEPSLPTQEYLLADRPRHILPWGERKPPVETDDPRNIWGFDMRLPDNSMNLGELHNLSTRRGTLTAEERFKINDHIVQTLIMLSALPFPRALRKVPDIAANHHERLDGAGYPRGLAASELGTPDRILAIADIFEALTAADRPYKEPKTLSESVNILCRMAREGHVDAQLLALFLESGVYLEYGRAFLRPEQLDEVDVRTHVRTLLPGSEPG
ncbi:MAG: HD domain-containing phosphohydrolase, partial [Pseudomonas sp.]